MGITFNPFTSSFDFTGSGVQGPSGATNNNIAIFDGDTGLIIKDSGIDIGRMLSDWIPDNDYKFQDFVVFDIDIYEATVNHTSGQDFVADYDSGNWKSISPTERETGVVNSTGSRAISPTTIEVDAGRGFYADINSSVRTIRTIAWVQTVMDTTAIPASSFFHLRVNGQTGIVEIHTGSAGDSIKNDILIGAGETDINQEIIFYQPAQWISAITDSKIQNLSAALGIIKTFGLKIEPVAATLNLVRHSGRMFALGSAHLSKEEYFYSDIPSQVPAQIMMVTSRSMGIRGAEITVLDPTTYEPGGQGVLQLVPAGRFTIMRIYMTTLGKMFILYGQNDYPSIALAEQAVHSENVVINTNLVNRNVYQWIGYLIVRNDCNDLADLAQCSISNCSLFGCAGVSASVSGAAAGDVFGPAVAVDNTIARFDETTGKIIQGSNVYITDTNQVLVRGGANALNISPETPYKTLDVVGDITTSYHGSNSQHDITERGTRLIGHTSGNLAGDTAFTGMKLNVTATNSDGGGNANHSQITFFTWGNSISNSREVVRITETGRVGIGTNNPTQALDVRGNIVLGDTNNISFGSNVGAKINLWGVAYGFGITNASLEYSAGQHHRFRTGGDTSGTGTERFRVSNNECVSSVNLRTSAGYIQSATHLYTDNGNVHARTTGSNTTSGNILLQNSRGTIVQLSASSSAGGFFDGASSYGQTNGGFGWQEVYNTTTGSPPPVRFNGPITAQSYNNNSDRILKKNISTIQKESLDKFKDIPVIQFSWRNKPYLDRDINEELTFPEIEERIHFGVVAQELGNIYPDMVEENEKEVLDFHGTDKAHLKKLPIKSYNVTDLLGLAIAKIQELEERIKVLEAR